MRFSNCQHYQRLQYLISCFNLVVLIGVQLLMAYMQYYLLSISILHLFHSHFVFFRNILIQNMNYNQIMELWFSKHLKFLYWIINQWSLKRNSHCSGGCYSKSLHSRLADPTGPVIPKPSQVVCGVGPPPELHG